MLDIHELTNRLANLSIIPVVTIDKPKDSIYLGEILVKHGLPVVEVTLRTDSALESIKILKETYPELLIGAGTVLNKIQVSQAKEAGVDFLVSPGLNLDTLHAANSLKVPMIPGVNNPSDIERALSLGLKTLKFFPAEASGGIPMLM